MDLITTQLGRFRAPGKGFITRGLPGSHNATVTVTGTGSVSATAVIRGGNSEAAMVTIGTVNVSGSGSAAASRSWTEDYRFWEVEVTALTGDVVSVDCASEPIAAGSGGSATPVVDALTSSSTTSALSANQGRALKTQVDARAVASKFRRRPTHVDGLAQGHTASSIWANDREVYVVRDISSAGTTWERVTNVNGFSTDGLTGVQFAGGFFQLVRGYNGPAFDITVTSGGTPTTYTINIVDNRLDVETLEHRLSLADAGTFVPVRQLYDQSGAGNHAVKDTLTHDLFLDWDEVLQSWVLVGDFLSSPTQTAAGLRLPNTVVTGSRSASVAVVGRSTYGCDDGLGAFGLLGASRNDTISSTVMTTIRTGLHTKMSYAAGALNGQRDLPLLIGQHPCVAVQTYGASNVELTVNGTKVSGPHAPNAGNQLGGWIGTDNPASASSKFLWRLAGCIITNAVIPDSQITRLTYGGCRDFNVRPQMTDSIYILTDSRNANSARLMRNWPHLLANYADGEFRVLNMGVATQTTETMRTQQMPRIAAQTAARPGAMHIAVILSAINDFIVNNRTAEQTYTFLQESCAAARANGCTHVIVVSELFTGNSAGGANTKLPELRALIESRGPATLGADSIVSVADLPGVNLPANTTYYYDGTHITERIHALIASAVWAAVRALR